MNSAKPIFKEPILDYNVHILLLEQAIIDNKKANQVFFYAVRNLFVKRDYNNIMKALNIIKKEKIEVDINGIIIIFFWLKYVKEYEKANIIIRDFLINYNLDFNSKSKDNPTIYEQELIKLHGCFW